MSVLSYEEILGFQSTPPCGGDGCLRMQNADGVISIHAPLRGRLEKGAIFGDTVKFQSTPPCGGDNQAGTGAQGQRISIHAPLRGRPCV